MNPVLRKGLIAVLSLCSAVCLALGVAACGGGHNFSEKWSSDDVAHWHACTDKGCNEKSDYEEHTPADEGTKVDEYIYYTCEVCGKEYRSESATYIVNVKNIGKAGIRGVSVSLYDESNNLLSTETSGTGGIVRFRNLKAANYKAVVDATTIPDGYTCGEEALTLDFTADVRAETVYLTPHLITDKEMPTGTKYSLGSVVYDFEYTAYYNDGASSTIKLSEYLKNYSAVVLQFFYTGCSPCREEFPYINKVYNYTASTTGENYYDKIGWIEFDSPTAGDTLGVMQNFITSSYGFDNFAYVYDEARYDTNFGVTAYPTTVVIDRYGVVAYYESGSQPSYSPWIKLFEYYSSDDYAPNYSSSGGSSDSDTDTTVIPNVTMPDSSEFVESIVTTDDKYTFADTFTFSPYSDEDGNLDIYSWPWLVSGKDDDEIDSISDYIYTSNAHELGTYSILVIDVQLEEGQVFMFDYFTSTEPGNDILYVQVDTVLQAQLSGEAEGWKTFYYVAAHTGSYQITLTYSKDSSIDVGDDKIYVSNMRLGLAEEIKDKKLPTPDLLYNAATAYTAEEGNTYGPGYGYSDYVSVYLSSDGYYHVDLYNKGKSDGDSPDGDPYLLADLTHTTPWNATYSVWLYAYVVLHSEDTDGSGDKDGILYKNRAYAEALEDYSWVQNNCDWNYVPVNEELATIIKAVVNSYGTERQKTNENQWLEVCRYFIHYGAAHSDGDSCYANDNLALTYGNRMPLYSGEVSDENSEGNERIIHVEVKAPVIPRGFYYSFTAKTDGVYLVYTNENADETTVDPYVWVAKADGEFIAENDDFDLSVIYSGYISAKDSEKYAYNSYIRVYLKAGEIYMICGAVAEDDGNFDVYIRYLGKELTYFTPVSDDYIYTYIYNYDEETDEETYEIYYPTFFSDRYGVDDEGFYAVNDDGTKSPIYINMTGTTYYQIGYAGMTLADMIENDYWTGANNVKMRDYLNMAKNNTDVTVDGISLAGFVRADETIAKILNDAINGGSSSEVANYCSNAWMLTAFYERTINAWSAAQDEDEDE